jgi:Zn-dependent alcohol dehydrogenase
MPGSTPRASRPRRLDTEAGSHSGALAVGLMGILAAKPPATERIIAMSRHAERQQLARLYDAMDIVDRAMDERGAIKVSLTFSRKRSGECWTRPDSCHLHGCRRSRSRRGFLVPTPAVRVAQ